MTYHLAIDIGASSGRHILGHVENGKIYLEEVYRFDNIQVFKNGHDCWNTELLFEHIVNGLKKCKKLNKFPSTLSIDTWGVDYILLDENGKPVCDAVAYRDKRTESMREKVEEIIPFNELYEKTGIQYQTFNTVYQLYSQKLSNPEELAKAKHFLMVPEYFNYLLTGKMMNEYTNASTTSLVNAQSKTWDKDIMNALGIPTDIFGELHMPKTTVGYLKPELKEEIGYDIKVVLPATHDTGSAFMAVPAKDDTSVYISSGTWSLLGVENTIPLTNPNNCDFSNEGGYEYRFRYLKNIMGLWMIQSVRRELNGVSYVAGKGKTSANDNNLSYADLEAMARKCSDFPSIIDVDGEEFLSPDSMIEAVKSACAKTNQQVPDSIGEIMQCVYQSLAHKYAESVKLLEKITGKTYTCINIVGGGSKDGYLNELTAKATGLKVYAGPTEGTALGNLMAQFIEANEFESLETARNAIHESFEIKNY